MIILNQSSEVSCSTRHTSDEASGSAVCSTAFKTEFILSTGRHKRDEHTITVNVRGPDETLMVSTLNPDLGPPKFQAGG